MNRTIAATLQILKELSRDEQNKQMSDEALHINIKICTHLVQCRFLVSYSCLSLFLHQTYPI